MSDPSTRAELAGLRSQLAALRRAVDLLPARYGGPALSYRPCVFKLYEQANEKGGSGGKYIVTILAGQSTAKLAGNLAMPEGLYLPSTDQTALALNLAENGLTGHAFDPHDKAYFFLGLYAGVVEKDKPKPDDVLDTPIVLFWAGGGTSVKWGKLTALWVPGQSTVKLQPVKDAAANPFPSPVPDPVDVGIIMPRNAVPAYLHGEINDLFAYEDLGGGALLLKNPQTTPIPVRKWEVVQNVGDAPTAPQWKADYMRAHNLAPTP